MAKTPARSLGKVAARAERSYVARQLVLPAQRFIHTAATSGIVLVTSALVALIWANSPWSRSYFDLWDAHFGLQLGSFVLSKSLQHWVNDGLMGVFFFVVGLEIKRELLQGELADRRRAMFPVAAALGGMVIPAAIYAALNAGSLGARGWGIPMATDIAFALGVLALLGDRIPSSLRVFLLALAIVDDLGAILVIAVFYTEQISWLALGAALLVLLLVFAMRLVGVVSVYLYILVGAMLWLAVLKSGVHATVAGVLLGAATPAQPYLTRRTFADSAQSLLTRFRKAMQAEEYETADAALGELEDVIEATESPLDRLLRVVHPWSSYLVLPVFALANSGVEVSPDTAARALNSAVTLGVGAGLILGKPIGILLFAWIAVRLAVADPLAGVNWKQLAGAGLLAGIGFTVSIFIASLSFEGTALLSEAKMGVLAGSLLAGVGGFLCLRLASTPAPRG